MIVISPKMDNKKHRDLHWDFLDETCRSFGATLHNIDKLAQIPKDNIIVALRHDKGALLGCLDLPSPDIVLVGCDDNTQDDWMNGHIDVQIETPKTYYLWSGVALGIFLYEINRIQNGAN